MNSFGTNIWLIALLCFFWGGCSSVSKNDPELLETAMSVHTEVLEMQGNPQQNLLRRDWPAPTQMAVENVYMYSLPYFPYFFYNGLLVYFKEGIWLPSWILTGGSSYQDDGDSLVVHHALRYRKVLEEFWPNHNSQANYINMDDWPKENNQTIENLAK